jgi:hypothetical protein
MAPREGEGKEKPMRLMELSWVVALDNDPTENASALGALAVASRVAAIRVQGE